MAQFSKYWPTAEALKISPRCPSTYRAPFIGWDNVAQGERSTEATTAQDCGKPMSATDVARFEALEPGQRACIDGIVYARD